jgi:quercetin dioxygenase-like cupin family protein
MSLFEGHRRSFLLTVGGLGISQVLSKGLLEGQATIPAEGAGSGFVLGPKQGEHLIHFRDRGNIFIKQGAATGSEHLGMGTQQVMTGTGIPVHRHLKMDEAFLVLEGSGTVLLNDFPHSFEKGGTISIPHNTWHGFENPDHELLLLWVVSPAGLDGFFRETCNRPDAPPKQLTRDQIKEIARKYDTEFR